jgi:hypothetical protein
MTRHTSSVIEMNEGGLVLASHGEHVIRVLGARKDVSLTPVRSPWAAPDADADAEAHEAYREWGEALAAPSERDLHDADVLYRRVVVNDALPPDGLSVLARSGELLAVALRADDLLVRVAPGQPGLGLVAPLLDGELSQPKWLAARGIASEEGLAGGYALVRDGADRALARRIIDEDGIVPPGQMVLRDYLTAKGGTSMAPHLTGTVALLHEAAGRALTIDEVRRALFETAAMPVGAPTHRSGHGCLDIAEAVRAASAWSCYEPTAHRAPVKLFESEAALPEKTDALRISFAGTALARTFHPDRFDISGETEVSVTISNAPANAVFEWNALDPSHVTIVSPAATTTKLRAGKPGITMLGFKVYDATKTTVLQLVSMKVGVPQFFVIRESKLAYTTNDGGRGITSGTRFDTILTQLQLTAEKGAILTEVRGLVNRGLCYNDHGALGGHNLRAIWQIGPFNETIPAHLVNPENKPTPDDFDVLYTTVLIAGFPNADVGLEFGRAFPPPGQQNGPGTPNELVLIYPGLIEMCRLDLKHPAGQCEEQVRLADQLQIIVRAYLADPKNAHMKAIMLLVLTRMIANTILHEVYHSVMDVKRDATGKVTEPDLDAQGHTVASATVKRDIMATCRDLVDRTAFKLVRAADLPASRSFELRPFTRILGLNAKNDERVNRNFPLPPTPPFGS